MQTEDESEIVQCIVDTQEEIDDIFRSTPGCILRHRAGNDHYLERRVEIPDEVIGLLASKIYDICDQGELFLPSKCNDYQERYFMTSEGSIVVILLSPIYEARRSDLPTSLNKYREFEMYSSDGHQYLTSFVINDDNSDICEEVPISIKRFAFVPSESDIWYGYNSFSSPFLKIFTTRDSLYSLGKKRNDIMAAGIDTLSDSFTSFLNLRLGQELDSYTIWCKDMSLIDKIRMYLEQREAVNIISQRSFPHISIEGDQVCIAYDGARPLVYSVERILQLARAEFMLNTYLDRLGIVRELFDKIQTE